MPNWCYSKNTFYTNSEDKSELLRLYKNLTEVMATPSHVENGFEPGWLGKVAMKHGFDWEKFPCRGYIMELDEYKAGDDYLTLATETAWSPTVDLWKAVVELYEGVSFVYIAEEPGNELYINTDTEGVYFPDRYLIDIYGDTPAPEGWYPNRDKPKSLEIHEYFESFDGLKEFCAKLTGKTFDTFDEMCGYFAEIFADADDVLCGVHKYEAA